MGGLRGEMSSATVVGQTCFTHVVAGRARRGVRLWKECEWRRVGRMTSSHS